MEKSPSEDENGLEGEAIGLGVHLKLLHNSACSH
jgi:hypothetical protein